MDMRIVTPEELEKEKLFDQGIRNLEVELKLDSSIEYDLTLYHNPPLILTNGDQFDPSVKNRVFDLFKKIFDQ